jgi:hypothetical protein
MAIKFALMTRRATCSTARIATLCDLEPVGHATGRRRPGLVFDSGPD